MIIMMMIILPVAAAEAVDREFIYIVFSSRLFSFSSLPSFFFFSFILSSFFFLSFLFFLQESLKSKDQKLHYNQENLKSKDHKLHHQGEDPTDRKAGGKDKKGQNKTSPKA